MVTKFKQALGVEFEEGTLLTDEGNRERGNTHQLCTRRGVTKALNDRRCEANDNV